MFVVLTFLRFLLFDLVKLWLTLTSTLKGHTYCKTAVDTDSGLSLLHWVYLTNTKPYVQMVGPTVSNLLGLKALMFYLYTLLGVITGGCVGAMSR